MFEKTLVDMVKGIRAHKRDEAAFIQKCIAEIKDELRSKGHSKKSDAVLKLLYLNMLGYDVSWSSFHIVEVMSSPKFSQKRIGYLAASCTFNESTEVTLLTTNLFKKDFSSPNQYEVGLALNCLSNICTEDLARDLVADVVALLNSGKGYVRKKALLALYKIFLKFPDALRPSFPRIKEKLDDREVAVASAGVNVICELARKNPSNYLSLAPTFFKLLTVSSNNWMLIKIVKLLGALTPLEPRLAKKMVQPITNILNTTPAKSLLYECIYTVSVGMTAHMTVVKLALEKLRLFVEDTDQNLKYLGLVAMQNFMAAHPKVSSEHREMILKCLDDEDITIRRRALALVVGMVTKKNLQELMGLLITHVRQSDGVFRDELVEKIITCCKDEGYANVTDFEWYLSTLCELTKFHGVSHGKLIAQQMMDVSIRVRVVRPASVASMLNLLLDPRVITEISRNPSLGEVLYAAGWIIGEFAQYVQNHVQVMEALLQPRSLSLPEDVQAVYLHNALKLFANATRFLHPRTQKQANFFDPESGEEAQPQDLAPEPVADDANVDGHAVMAQLADVVLTRVDAFLSSVHVEVQERAATLQKTVEILMKLAEEGSSQFSRISVLFEEELNPVSSKAQKKVPVPEGLDLDAWINEPPKAPEPTSGDEFSDEEAKPKEDDEDDEEDTFKLDTMVAPKKKLSKKELKKLEKEKERERKRRAEDPFYLPSQKYAVPEGIDDIPIYDITPSGGSDELIKQEKKRREPVEVMLVDAMPDGASSSDDDTAAKGTDLNSRLDVDISAPLGKHEVLPTQRTYGELELEKRRNKAKEDRKERHKKDKSHRHRSKRDKENQEGEDFPDVAEAAPAGAASELINFGAPGTASADDEGEEATAAAAAAGANGGGAEGGVLVAPAGGAGYEQIDAAATPPTEKTRRSSKHKKEKSERHHRSKEEKKRDKDKDKSSRRSESKQRATSSSSATASALDTSPLPTVNRVVPLCSDAAVSLSVSVSSAPEQKVALASVSIVNNSDTAIEYVEFVVSDSMNVALEREKGRSEPVRTPFGLAPGETKEHTLRFKLSSLSSLSVVKGSAVYRLQDSETDSDKMSFDLTFPMSAFVHKQKLTVDEFTQVMQDGQFSYLGSTSFPATTAQFSHAVKFLADLLHLEPVEVVGSSASLHGLTTHSHHITALIKIPEPTATLCQVNIKCSEAKIGAALIAEVDTLFPQ